LETPESGIKIDVVPADSFVTSNQYNTAVTLSDLFVDFKEFSINALGSKSTHPTGLGKLKISGMTVKVNGDVKIDMN